MSLSYSDKKHIRDYAGKGSDNSSGCGVIIFIVLILYLFRGC